MTAPAPGDNRGTNTGRRPVLVQAANWKVVGVELTAGDGQRYFDARGQFDEDTHEPFPDVAAAATALANSLERVWVLADTATAADIGFLTFSPGTRQSKTRGGTSPLALDYTAWIVPKWQGQGVAPAVIRVVAAVMHDVWGTKGLRARIHSTNAASQIAAMKLGLVETDNCDDKGYCVWDVPGML